MNKKKLIKILVILGILYALAELGRYVTGNDADTNARVKEPGEIVATFDNGDGTSDYIRRNGRVFQLEVNYPGGGADNKVMMSIRNQFDYRAVHGFDKDVTSNHFLRNFQAYLAVRFSSGGFGSDRSRYPFAGAATNPIFTKLKINNQAADEVREYTDSNGKTWYLWYYRDLKLNLGNNEVSFE